MTGTVSLTSFPARDRTATRLLQQVRYTGPASYVAGGDPIAGSDLGGGGDIYSVQCIISNGSAIRIGHWDYANQKLLFFVPNTGAEASGDLSGYTGVLTVTLKG